MFEVLKKYGFSEKFIKWVEILLTNIESSVSNNGYTTGYFQIERGTRQGDPLASILFITVIELVVNIVKHITHCNILYILPSAMFSIVNKIEDVLAFLNIDLPLVNYLEFIKFQVHVV